MINEDIVYYIDELTGEKKIFITDDKQNNWKNIQKEAKKQLEKKKITIVKKEDGFLWVYEE